MKSTPHSSPLLSDNQSTLEGLVSPPKKYSTNDQQQTNLTDALVTFIAGDLMPLSVVESPRFQALMSLSDPRFQFSSRKLFRNKLLPEKSAQVKKNIMRFLQNASVVCVTADLWSSRQLRSFLGITAHFIVKSEWSLKSVMLACSRFRGSHTAEADNSSLLS